MSDIRITPTQASEQEVVAYREHLNSLKRSPIPDTEILANLGLFLNRSSLSRILFFDHLYKLLLNNSGVIMQFGVRWGRDLATLMTLRTIYEPFNFGRKIVGFDTFEGFPDVSNQDGQAGIIEAGSLAVAADYKSHLEQLLTAHEQLSPRSNLRKFELVEGDVRQSLPDYLKRHPETQIAFAHFDLDLYEPTLECLKCVEPHVSSGTVIGFDELSMPVFPGETLALRECGWLRNARLRRLPMMGYESYAVVEF